MWTICPVDVNQAFCLYNCTCVILQTFNMFCAPCSLCLVEFFQISKFVAISQGKLGGKTLKNSVERLKIEIT